MLMEIQPSWLHTVAQENQRRLEGNSLGQIGYLNIGTVIRGLQGSWFALAGSCESWRVSSPCIITVGWWGSPEPHCNSSAVHHDTSTAIPRQTWETCLIPLKGKEQGPLTPSTPISMLKSTWLIPGLSFPSLLLFFLISSHLPKKGSAAASLRAYSQSKDARNAFNWLEFASLALCKNLVIFTEERDTQKSKTTLEEKAAIQ